MIKISSTDFKAPRSKRQAALVSSEETIDESAVQTKKVSKMSLPTPEQQMQFYNRLSKTNSSPVVLSHTSEFNDKHVPVSKITGFPKPLVKHSQALSAPPSKVWVVVKGHWGSYLYTLLLHGWCWGGLCSCRICALCSRSQHKN